MDVKEMYKALVAQGMSEKDAAKQVQGKTGYSVVTGRPIQQKKVNFTKGRITYGQYGIKK